MSKTETKRDMLYEAGLAWDKAVGRLSDEQGRVGRNNARKDALTALNKMRKLLDSEFPVIRKKAKTKTRSKDPRAVQARKTRARNKAYDKLVKDGYELLSAKDDPADAKKIKALVGHGVRARKDPDGDLWFPIWAIYAVEKCPSRIRKAKRSRDEREVLAGLAGIDGAHRYGAVEITRILAQAGVRVESHHRLVRNILDEVAKVAAKEARRKGKAGMTRRASANARRRKVA